MQGEAVHRAIAAKDHSPHLIDCLKVTDNTFLVVMEKFDSEMLDVYWLSVLECERKLNSSFATSCLSCTDKDTFMVIYVNRTS